MRSALTRLSLILSLAMAAPAFAQQVDFGGLKQDTTLPVEVTADQLAVDQTSGEATFTRRSTSSAARSRPRATRPNWSIATTKSASEPTNNLARRGEPAGPRQVPNDCAGFSRTRSRTPKPAQDGQKQVQTTSSIWSSVSRPFAINSARASSGSVVNNRTRRSSSARENDT